MTKIIWVILGILFIAAIGTGFLFLPVKQEMTINEQKPSEVSYSSSSSASQQEAKSTTTAHQVFTVSGYSVIKQVPEAWCEENCPLHPYLFFEIIDTEGNEKFFDFLKIFAKTPYADMQRIGLGCVENGVITYTNDSKEFGWKEHAVSPELSKAILQSTKADPVRLTLERWEDRGGSAAPTCYSHITNIRPAPEPFSENEIKEEGSSFNMVHTDDGAFFLRVKNVGLCSMKSWEVFRIISETGEDVSKDYTDVSHVTTTNGMLAFIGDVIVCDENYEPIKSRSAVHYGGEEISGTYEYVDTLVVINGKIAYDGYRDGSRYIVYDGEEFGPYEVVNDPSKVYGKGFYEPIISVSNTLAYVGKQKDGFYVYHGADVFGPYENIYVMKDLMGVLFVVATDMQRRPRHIVLDNKEYAVDFDIILDDVLIQDEQIVFRVKKNTKWEMYSIPFSYDPRI